VVGWVFICDPIRCLIVDAFKLIAAASDYQNKSLLQWCNKTIQNKVKEIIQRVYSDFTKIMLGTAEGKSEEESDVWRIALVAFLKWSPPIPQSDETNVMY